MRPAPIEAATVAIPSGDMVTCPCPIIKAARSIELAGWTVPKLDVKPTS